MSEKEEKPPKWVPLSEVLEILNHPDFYWGATMPDAKYIELRIDTRDNHCLVSDRRGKALDLDSLRKLIERAGIKGMNRNVASEEETLNPSHP